MGRTFMVLATIETCETIMRYQRYNAQIVASFFLLGIFVCWLAERDTTASILGAAGIVIVSLLAKPKTPKATGITNEN